MTVSEIKEEIFGWVKDLEALGYSKAEIAKGFAIVLYQLLENKDFSDHDDDLKNGSDKVADILYSRCLQAAESSEYEDVGNTMLAVNCDVVCDLISD